MSVFLTNTWGDNFASVGSVVRPQTVNVFINGNKISTELLKQDERLTIQVCGDVINSVSIDGSGDITVEGNVGGNVSALNGDVTIANT